MLIKPLRIAMNTEDSNPGTGQPGTPAPGSTSSASSSPPAPPPTDTIDWRKKFEESERSKQSLVERLSNIEQVLDKTGDLASQLEAIKKDAQDKTAKLQKYEEQENAKAEEILKKIPEEHRKTLEPLKKSFDDVAGWTAFLEAQAKLHGGDPNDPSEPPKPPTGERKGPKDKVKRYKPQYTEEIEDGTGRDVIFLDRLQMAEDARTGDREWTMRKNDWRNYLLSKAATGVKLDEKAAADRELLVSGKLK